MSHHPVALIVGGSSGLGYRFAKSLSAEYQVHITGRRDPNDAHLRFHPLDLATQADVLEHDLGALIKELPDVALLAYCAGATQLGRIDECTAQQITEQTSVGVVAPSLLIGTLLRHQQQLDVLVIVTSTTQRIPREKEPVYAASKAGLGMLAKSLSLDTRIGKTLVVGPGGMKTRFWEGTDIPTTGFLEPEHVAQQITSQLSGAYRYRHIEIPRQTGIATIIEERN